MPWFRTAKNAAFCRKYCLQRKKKVFVLVARHIAETNCTLQSFLKSNRETMHQSEGPYWPYLLHSALFNILQSMISAIKWAFLHILGCSFPYGRQKLGLQNMLWSGKGSRLLSHHICADMAFSWGSSVWCEVWTSIAACYVLLSKVIFACALAKYELE